MGKCNTKNLYTEHRVKLLSLIQSKVKDSQQAEDILHDSFIKLETCCQADCECSHPKSYLFKVAINTVMDFYKRKKKQQEIESANPTDLLLADQEPESLDVEKIYASIFNHLKEMTPENQQAYIMVDVEQRSQKEVAELLDLPISTLKSRVQRTRQALRKRIEEEGLAKPV